MLQTRKFDARPFCRRGNDSPASARGYGVRAGRPSRRASPTPVSWTDARCAPEICAGYGRARPAPSRRTPTGCCSAAPMTAGATVRLPRSLPPMSAGSNLSGVLRPARWKGPIRRRPIVNNGVMFVATPGNQIIALEAKTGDLLWPLQATAA